MVINIKKKILCFAICIISSIIMMNSSKIFASEIDYSNIYSKEEIEILANHWLKSNYNDSTKMDEIIPVKSNDNIILYCVDFIKDDTPNGYVMINAFRESKELYTEFSLTGNSIYDTICINNDIDKSEEKVLYNIGSLNYALKYEDEYCSLDKKMYNHKTVKELMKRNKKKVYSDYESGTFLSFPEGVQEESKLPPLLVKEEAFIEDGDTFSPMSNEFFLEHFGHTNTNNCVPTAANNIIRYYRDVREFNNFPDNLYDIYKDFLTHTNFRVNDPSDLGMTENEFANAMKKYVDKVGYDFSSNKYWWDWFSDWRRDILRNYPVYTSIRGYVDNNPDPDIESFVEQGHAVVTVGYRTYQNDTNYLIVYDGWNWGTVRYIYFDSDYFTSIDGMRVKIK